MSIWLYIGKTGVNILEILELVSRGYSCPEIRRRFPDLSQSDLAQAAGEILTHIIRHLSADILFDARGRSIMSRPASFHDDTPWTGDEDEELLRLVKYRFNRNAIARLLRRSEQAVGARVMQIKRPIR